MDTLFSTTNLGKRGKGRPWLFKNINLKISSGEIIIIQGGIASGKTLLSDILCGLKKPNQGTVERRVSLAVATQEFTLYKDLTARENLDFISTINNNSRVNQLDVIGLTGLKGWERKKAFKLPAGLRKMLQTACAVISGAAVLIFDEPTQGLDLELNSMFWQLVKNLAQEGRGVLILTSQPTPADIPARIFSLTENGLLPLSQTESVLGKNLEYESKGVG